MMRVLLVAAFLVVVLAPRAPPHGPAPALWWPPQPERALGPLPNSSTHDYAEYFGRLRRAMAAGDTIAAFYGAKGHGALALSKHSPNDCRSLPLQVLTVTNGDNSGSGSLRQALSDAHNDSLSVILFQNGTKITITSRVYVLGKCIILAGQSAPGGGVTVTGHDFYVGRGAVEGAQDVVIRSMRFRGKTGLSFTTNSGTASYCTAYFIFDHISSYWGDDNGRSMAVQADSSGGGAGRCSEYWTIQYTIVAEPDSTATGFVITGQPRPEPPQKHGTLWRSYLVHIHHRTPNVIMDTLQIIQMIAYNWREDGAVQLQDEAIFDVISSYFKVGPYNVGGADTRAFEFLDTCTNDGGDGVCEKSVFITKLRTPRNNWTLDIIWDDSVWTGSNAVRDGHCKDNQDVHATCDCVTDFDPLDLDCRRTDALPFPRFQPDTAWLTNAKRDAVLDSVGAFFGVDSAGQMRVIRDRVDSMRVQDFYDGDMTPPLSGGGHFGVDTFTVDAPSGGTAWADQDGDGMPNAFEKAMLGSTTDSTSLAPGSDCGSNGYLNIEEWLNAGLAEAGTLTWTDNADNEEENRVYRWQSGSGWALLIALGADIETYTVPGGSWAVGDSLKVHAWNSSGGESDPSNVVVVTCP